MLNLEPIKQKLADLSHEGMNFSDAMSDYNFPCPQQILDDMDDLLAEVERLREAWKMRVGATTT